jgi:hypothetical protein
MRSLVPRVARVLGVVGVMSIAGLPGRARADTDSLNNLLGPREIAVGEAMRGGATGQAGADLNPAGIALNHELVFEGSYGYRPDDSASLVGVSACDSTTALPGCFFYDYAGSDPGVDGMPLHRGTHVGGVSLSRMVVPRILIGATAKYFHVSSDLAGESTSGTTFDFGITARLTNNINLGASAQNLLSSTDSTQFPRAIGGGLYVHPFPILALSFDARWKMDTADDRARYGGGAELFLSGNAGQSGYPIRVGALHDNNLDTTYLSAGLGYASVAWGLDVAGRRQIKGGDETLIIASLRVFGPRLASTPLE